MILKKILIRSLNYTSYMVKLNNHEIGAGFGSGMNTSPVKAGTEPLHGRMQKQVNSTLLKIK